MSFLAIPLWIFLILLALSVVYSDETIFLYVCLILIINGGAKNLWISSFIGGGFHQVYKRNFDIISNEKKKGWIMRNFMLEKKDF